MLAHDIDMVTTRTTRVERIQTVGFFRDFSKASK